MTEEQFVRLYEEILTLTHKMTDDTQSIAVLLSNVLATFIGNSIDIGKIEEFKVLLPQFIKGLEANIWMYVEKRKELQC